jgi:putative transposase
MSVRSCYLHNRLEQDHRRIKQHYYPMRGFGCFTAATRFCCAHDEPCDYVRYRRMMRESVPLADQRRMFGDRWTTLMVELAAA